MMNISDNTIWLFTAGIFVASYIAMSYKAGFLILFSPESGRAVWEVKKDKILTFTVAVLLTFAIFYALFYIILKQHESTHDFYILNSVDVSFALLIWILLKTPMRIKDKKELRNIFDEGDWKVPK